MHKLPRVLLTVALLLLASLGAQAHQTIRVTIEGVFTLSPAQSPFNLDDRFSFTITMDNSDTENPYGRSLTVNSILSSTLLINDNPVAHRTPTFGYVDYLPGAFSGDPSYNSIAFGIPFDQQDKAMPFLNIVRIPVFTTTPVFNDFLAFNGVTGTTNQFAVAGPGHPNDVVIIGHPTITVVMIPEPSTYAMMALGAVGCAFALRRRGAAKA